ncbi:MAG: GNAT family N-acetyltransferase [Acidimicrobiia bacterium]
MEIVVPCDPGQLIERAGPWLETEPVLHNVICTALSRATAEPHRFGGADWFAVEDAGNPVGVAILTPPFPLRLTPMSDAALDALVDLLAERRPDLPGATGSGDVAARFARRWTERTGAAVSPGMGLLMYRLDAVEPPPPAPGTYRRAGDDDRALLEDWFLRFVTEAGAIAGDIAAAVNQRLALGALHLWEDGAVVSLTGTQPPVAGVVRIGPVYTPPELRGRGYASNCVATVSRQALDRGASACMLYTDTENRTSNAIFQRIGYRRVAEACEYRFSYTG